MQSFLTSYNYQKKGYFSSLKINRGEEYADKFNGKPRMEPRLTLDESKIKIWKTKSAAVKYADTLSDRLKTVRFNPQLEKPYRYCMYYHIEVIDIETKSVIHCINTYSYDSTC